MGDKIVALRRKQQLSQAALATRAGVGQGTISKIERGQISPTTRMLQKIAAALNTTPADLLQTA
jgi:transcriptional regulator with XRE-family HTH domain